MVRNWKRRYFVLEKGVLRYYEKKASGDVSPYGESLKGEVDLLGANISMDEKTNGMHVMLNVLKN